MSAARRLPPADPNRRGWCPSLARPMLTGDGLLARVHPPLGVLSAVQLRAVAESARRYGNGHVDITARGNLQIRGASEATTPALAARLTAIGLGDVRSDGGPQRLTLTSALPDPGAMIDASAVARAVEAIGLTVPGLPAKTLVAIESGGRWTLGSIDADLHVWPVGRGSVAIGLASEMATAWGMEIAVDQAPAALGRLLRVFAGTGRRRIRDLDEHKRARMAAAVQSPSNPQAPSPRAGGRSTETPEPGLIHLSSDLVAVLAEAPFGRCTADGLDSAAGVTGDAGIRFTPQRGLVIVDHPARAAAILEILAAAGFITDPKDPRRAVAACPGAPACASGTTPVPDHAAQLAKAFAPFALRGLSAHVSGCTKGCAHPRKADLTLVAEGGRYRVAIDGSPGDAGQATRLTFEAALDRVRKADPAESLAKAFM